MNKDVIDSCQLVADICDHDHSIVHTNSENVIIVDITASGDDGKINIKLAIEKSDAETLIKQLQQAINNCRHT